jgi:hypothetical protein
MKLSMVQRFNRAFDTFSSVNTVTPKPKVSIKELQSYLSSADVTEILSEYRETVEGIYRTEATPKHIGHGPCHSFLGWLIKEGKLDV